MTYEETGAVTSRTANSMSLAWALGYIPRKSLNSIILYRRISRFSNTNMRRVGVTQRDVLFKWLQQHHDLDLIPDQDPQLP